MGSHGDPKSGGLGTKVQSTLPPELQGHIGQRLRDAYYQLVNEPVPDRFVNLLLQLQQKEKQECAPELQTEPEPEGQAR